MDPKPKTTATAQSPRLHSLHKHAPRPKPAPARRTGARKVRLERIRKEIQKGTYETEGKLRIAVSRLIDDVLASYPRPRR